MSLTCLEFRQIVGAVPASRDEAVRAHRRECRACAEYADTQLALDRRLHAALRLPVPEDLKARVIWNQTGRWQHRAAPRGLALAAGLLLVAGLGFAFVQWGGSPALPADVVAHIAHEPQLLARGYLAAAPVRVNAVLDRGGAALARPLENVVHAGLCPFRGQMVPHLVVNVDGEPVSVLLLPGERIAGPREIDENGYHGVLIPHGEGSMAVVAARPDLVLPVRRQLEQAVRWRI